MAIKQTLIHRIFNICNTNFSHQTLRNCRISSSSTATHVFIPPNPDTLAPDPGDATAFRRFLRPRDETMLERLKEMDITRGRIRLDVLSPPPPPPPQATEFTVADAKKVLRVSQIEKLKVKLSNGYKNHVSYDEFVEICVDGCSSRDQGLNLAKALDDSGSVIVLGDVVFLKPDQGCLRWRQIDLQTNPGRKMPTH